ncbi:phospholipase D-like domain-containing protein [Limoniibacter endophyticus]|uniref:Phospholipase D n=1 Tax=Limoniibacter endophyticus TaxID=1565040 RepID=A0A8J3DGB9_9HYPH|nr:phospholipase D-like domain-containing protein [Limoniibacter endophyticus]GHC64129.1 phospholipase D/transphosphatidylase [Limoniibacter endophyticus]
MSEQDEPAFSAIEGESCWRYARADKMTVIVDAEDYFAAAKHAMLRAKHSIMLIGWDFDARVKLEPEKKTMRGPNRIGQLLNWLAKRKPNLDIYLLKWDIGTLLALGRGQTPLFILDWMTSRSVHLRLDHAHPALAAHHMKLLVIDDVIAFCGGIDMTEGRWDTRLHREQEEQRRTMFRGKQLMPWHDATSCVTGEAASALGDLARERWRRATGENLTPPPTVAPIWCDNLEMDFENVDIAIARTIASFDDYEQVSEIESLKLRMIKSAQKTLYIESQYFAARKIAYALADRLREDNPPEIVLINPLGADGWLEAKVMDSARQRLLNMLREADHKKRFRVYYPVNEARSPIYVHAKIMIADDCSMKIGSANLNNRSMGYDTECDLMISANRQDDEAAVREAIARCRNDLLAEHLGSDEETIAAAITQKGLIGAIEALRQGARRLEPLPERELSDDERAIAETDLVDPERPVTVGMQLWDVGRRIMHLSRKGSA